MITQSTLDFIREEEGLSLTSYKDNTRYSIGYGCTFYEDGTPVKAGQTITKARADELLLFHAQLAEKYVKTYIKRSLNQNQLDALVSLMFNIGPGNFSQKWNSVMIAVNKDPNDFTAIETAFKAVPHLPQRRIREASLYVQGTYQKKNYGALVVVAAGLLSWYILKK